MLFSSDEQAVPQGKEGNHHQDQGGAGGEVAKHKPRVFAAEKPGGWMDNTKASLVDEGDQCITVGQLCPPPYGVYGPCLVAGDPRQVSGGHCRRSYGARH